MGTGTILVKGHMLVEYLMRRSWILKLTGGSKKERLILDGRRGVGKVVQVDVGNYICLFRQAITSGIT